MPSGIELASAYVTLIPSLKGAAKQIEAQISGVNVTAAGRKLGRSLSESMSAGMDTSALDGYQRAVERAERSVTDAKRREQEAISRVEMYQARLNEVVDQYGEKSSRAIAANMDLARAQYQQETAQKATADATERLRSAQDELADATDRARRSEEEQSTVSARLSRAINSLGDAASAAGSKLNALGSRMMGAGASLSAAVTAPMAAAAVGVGKFALETASAAETSEIAFTTMLGGAEAARDMMDDLSDFASSTPFELSGLTTATQQLLAYGFAAEDIIPMLTAVGDATAALGTGQEGIDSVTRALGQLRTRGKASAEEMMQLTEAGIPAWEYLAEAIGTDTATAMEMVTDGAVDANTAIQAMTEGMERDFGGMMEEQSKTVAGLMSNLSDAIQRPLMELRDTDAYDRLADSLGELVDAAGPFVESLMPHMERGLDALSDVLDLATGAMEEFSSMSEESQGNILKAVGAIAAAGPALIGVGTAIRGVGAAFSALGSVTRVATGAYRALESVGGAIGRWSKSMQPVAYGLTTTASAIEGTASGAERAATSTSKLSKAMGALGKVAGIGVVATIIYEIGNAAANAIWHLDTLNAAFDEGAGALGSFAQASDTANASLSTLDQTIVGSTGYTIGQHYQEISDQAGYAMDALQESLRETGAVSDDAMAQVEASISAMASNAQATVDGYAQAMEGKSIAASSLGDMDESQAAQLVADINGIAEQGRAALEADREQAIAIVNAKYQAMGQLGSEANLAELAQVQQHYDQMEASLQQSADTQLAQLGSMYGGMSAEQAASMGELTQLAAQYSSEWAQKWGQSLPWVVADWENAFTQMDADALSGYLGIQATTVEAGGQLTEANRQNVANIIAVFDTMAGVMPNKGLDAIRALASGMESQIPALANASSMSADEILNTISQSLLGMDSEGAIASADLAAGMVSGTGTVSAAASSVGQAAMDGVSTVPDQMGQTGTDGGLSMAGGMSSETGDVSAAGSELAAATESARGNNEAASGWGAELGANFASGISSMIDRIASAASAAASAVASFLHFSEPDVGPLVGINESGRELVDNYADSMLSGLPALRRASSMVAMAARPEVDAPMAADWRDWANVAPGGRSAYAAARGGDVYNISLDGVTVNADERIREVVAEFVRQLARVGVM